jgi:hypothetical protein
MPIGSDGSLNSTFLKASGGRSPWPTTFFFARQ